MDQNKINSFKDAFQRLLNFVTDTEAVKFEAVQVKDSDQIIEYSALEVGADVQISTSAGSEPAPDSKYILVNGSAITVVGGKITEIEQPDAEVEVADEEMADDATVDYSKEIAYLTDRVSKIEEALKALTDKAPSKEDFKKFSDEFKETVSELAKIPTQFSNTNIEEVKEDEQDKWRKIAERYGNKK